MKTSFFALHEFKGFEVHHHPETAECPGNPRCPLNVFTSVGALADELMSATIDFANARISHPREVSLFYRGAYAPISIPRLRTCRDIQKEIRAQLIEKDFDDHGPVSGNPRVFEVGYTGLADKPLTSLHLVGEPMNFFIEDGHYKRGRKPKLSRKGHPSYSVEYFYSFASASLRELAGLGVGYLMQNDLKDKVGLCAREGCDNVFLDNKSRGKARIYCKTDECDLILNRERVGKSRNNRK